jgi:stage II sporulation protein D
LRPLALAVALFVVACSTRAPRRPAPGRPEPSGPARPTPDASALIRVALIVPQPIISATREFSWFQPDGGTLVSRARRGEQWRVEVGGANGRQVRTVRPDGVQMPWMASVIARMQDDGFLTVNGKRYRGTLVLSAPDGGVSVVNHLPLDDYLRSVVGTERGNRPRSDSAALQAQPVPARTFAYVKLNGRGAFDIRASVADQAYGGVDAENATANEAVDATAGLMVRYQGRVANVFYFSTCGGSTAEPPEVWRTGGQPYLQAVSDRIGTSNRYYCDAAPRFKWTRSWSASELNETVAQYLKAYSATAVPAGGPGAVRHVAANGKTKSGRTAAIDVETARGAYAVRGDDIRYVLRTSSGEMLPSTYFSVEPEYGQDGVLARLTLRGQGYGHGVGMCQWGALGRARAGQSFRQILGTYYPGTTVGPIQ